MVEAGVFFTAVVLTPEMGFSRSLLLESLDPVGCNVLVKDGPMSKVAIGMVVTLPDASVSTLTNVVVDVGVIIIGFPEPGDDTGVSFGDTGSCSGFDKGGFDEGGFDEGGFVEGRFEGEGFVGG